MKFLEILKATVQFMKNLNKNKVDGPKYRVVEIFKDDDDTYSALLQIINKNATFYAKPEEILADNNFVDCLSPRDVRTLTYLGYLSLNQPQYKILAQRLSEKSEVFVMKKRGEKKPIIKTATEISKEMEMISKMNSQDAKTIGYAIANSEIKQEKLEKNEIKKINNQK